MILQDVQIGPVIKQYRQKKGLTQTELAEQLDTKRNTVACWETDRYKPDFTSLARMCEILSMPPNELFGYESKTDIREDELHLIHQYRGLSSTKKTMVQSIMDAVVAEDAAERHKFLMDTFAQFYFVPDTAAAGVGDGYGTDDLQLVYLRKQPDLPNAEFIVKVKGRSMEPQYDDGDLVYVEKTQHVRPGADVVCYTDDGLVIKRLDKQRHLYSVNPDYPFPDQYEDDHVEIFGRVVGIVSRADFPTKEQQRELLAM